MKEEIQKPLLNPVQRADFKENFGGNKALKNVQPQNYFLPAINLFKKLAAGPYFWFVANTATGITHSVGGMLEKIIPVKKDDFVNHSPEVLFKNCHPEDITRMFAFTNYWISFFMGLPPERKLHVRPTMYIRLQNPAQVYKWVMVQYADHILDKEGRIAYGLTLVTDISHIKKEGVATMSIFDSYDDSCQHFFCAGGKALPDTGTVLPKISAREIEVLRFLAIGFSSKQIATELNIATKTIDNQRQSLLHKINTKSSGQLVGYGINRGFIL